MSSKDAMAPARPVRTRVEIVLDQYVIALSVVMMLFGLRQWAVILGIIPGAGGAFDTMTAAWAVATMHMAVVDLVAAVGLWMRVAWGKVIWVYAALFEVAIHTVFIGTFGSDLPVVAFHVATLLVFLTLTIMVRRAAPR